MQSPIIESIPTKILVGRRHTTTLVAGNTALLWKSFMPLLSQVPNRMGNHLLSVQLYSAPDTAVLADMHTPFEQWAAAEVSELGVLPQGLESFNLPGGLYAVFVHKGTPAGFYKTAQFIYEQWLPKSGYLLDHRPHFEVLGDKYRHNHPESEEEVYVPIRPV